MSLLQKGNGRKVQQTKFYLPGQHIPFSIPASLLAGSPPCVYRAPSGDGESQDSSIYHRRVGGVRMRQNNHIFCSSNWIWQEIKLTSRGKQAKNGKEQMGLSARTP